MELVNGTFGIKRQNNIYKSNKNFSFSSKPETWVPINK